MGWKDVLIKKAQESIAVALFGLIGFLLLVVWGLVPSSAWGTVSERTPKRVLWALLGLAVIGLGLVTALFFDYRRAHKLILPSPEPPPPPPKPFRRFGVHWDEEFNPLCSVCDILLPISEYVESNDETIQVLICPKCKARYTLRTDDGERLLLAEVKAFLSGKNEDPYG